MSTSPPAGPEAFFAEQFELIDAFLHDPDAVCLRLLIDPEMRRMPLRYLEGREEQPDFPHLLLHFTEPFGSPYSWYALLLRMLEDEIAGEAEALAQSGVQGALAEGAPEGKPWERFLDRADGLAAALPDHVGALAFVLEPEEMRDRANWARGIRFLADFTKSPWLKFILLDPRQEPLLEELAALPRVRTQLFWLSPEEIERRADAVLAQTGGIPEVLK